MPKSKSRKKKTPTRVLALPDLEQTKATVLNSLTSASGQRTYDHAIESLSPGTARSHASPSTAPLCSGTVFTSNNAGMRLPRLTFGSPRFAAWRTRLRTPAS